jgi:hypothetical protein
LALAAQVDPLGALGEHSEVVGERSVDERDDGLEHAVLVAADVQRCDAVGVVPQLLEGGRDVLTGLAGAQVFS